MIKKNKAMKAMLTADDIAERLNVHPRTVYRMFKDRDIPHYVIRGQKRVKREDFEAWLERQRREEI